MQYPAASATMVMVRPLLTHDASRKPPIGTELRT